MDTNWQSAEVTRLGVAVPGSPFDVKLRYRRLHIEPLIAPIADKRPVQEFVIFANINAKVNVGDILTLAGGGVSKIIDVRSYPNSLQCMLQRTTFRETPLWIPVSPVGQIGSTKSLGDVTYQSTGTALILLEPHGDDHADPLPLGQTDRRRCFVFSAQPLVIQTVLSFNGDYWMLTDSSSVWLISNDFRAPARRLALPPLGVG